MQISYSPSRRGFYVDVVTYANLPDDLIDIDIELHTELMAAQEMGATIVPDEDGTPIAVYPAVPTPEETLQIWRSKIKVSRFQALAALHGSGLLDEAVEVVTEAGGLIKLAWDNATEFRRNSPTILDLASALGLDEEALDALFIVAAQIEV